MHAGIKIKQMQQRDLNDSSQALRQAEQLQVRYTTVLKNSTKYSTNRATNTAECKLNNDKI